MSNIASAPGSSGVPGALELEGEGCPVWLVFGVPVADGVAEGAADGEADASGFLVADGAYPPEEDVCPEEFPSNTLIYVFTSGISTADCPDFVTYSAEGISPFIPVNCVEIL